MLWTLLIGIVFLIAQVIAAGVYIAFAMRDVPRAKMRDALGTLQFDGAFVSLCAFGSLIACVPLIVGIVKLKRNANLKDYLGLTLPSLRQLWRWSLFTVAFCLLTDGVISLLHQPMVSDFMLKTYANTSPRWLLWLALAVAAPVFEEICFRGFIFTGLAASRLRWQGATIITALLWASIHVQYDWYGMATIFALGLVLGAARAMTGSTLLTMSLHCLINLLATIETAIALGRL
jgi:membrane protease YdiL (CAAX protease family)